MIRPRIRSLPPALGTRCGEVFELAERLGYTLDDWQRLALNDILAVDDQGKLAAFEAVLEVARQREAPSLPCLANGLPMRFLGA